LSDTAVETTDELPLEWTYVGCYQVVVVYGIKLVNSINHVSKTVNKVEEDSHKVI